MKILLRIALGVTMIVAPAGLRAQSALIKDINPNMVTTGSDPSTFIEVNGVTYFNATTAMYGKELWRTDGTEAGTLMLKDIYPGPDDGSRLMLGELNGYLLFQGYDPENGSELWKTDGTREGTSLVKDIRPGLNGGSPQPLGVINNKMIFIAYNEQYGTEAWVTDGTPEGTMVLKDIINGSGSSYPSRFNVINGVAYFFAANELWRTDGVEVTKTDVNWNGVSYNTTTYNNHIYFVKDGDLWKTNGTNAGTLKLKNFESVYEFEEANGMLFVVAEDATLAVELYKTDGTVDGTTLVKDISTPYRSSSWPTELVAFQNMVIFRATDGNGTNLWRSDGTEAGTTIIKKVEQLPVDIKFGGDEVFFSNYTTAQGNQIWRTDGTEAGTYIVDVIDYQDAPGALFKTSSNLMLFSAGTNNMGRELWSTDGSHGSTFPIKDINTGAESGSPAYLSKADKYIFFAAEDGTNGNQLWRTDGTTAGTTMIIPDEHYRAMEPQYIVNLNDRSYFVGVARNAYELWTSDGTNEGTTPIPVATMRYPSDLFTFNNMILFTGQSDGVGYELWKTDGTVEGTSLVKDVVPGNSSSFPYAYTRLNDNEAIFITQGDNFNVELWKTDGTSAGTVPVKVLSSGISTAFASDLVLVSDYAIFITDDVEHGRTLWRTDGTEEGTFSLKDIRQNASDLTIRFPVVSGNTLYFVADDGIHGWELWKTDGTTAGTVMVKDIIEGSPGSEPAGLLVKNELVYFTAFGDDNSLSLWASDGTSNGTTLIRNLADNATLFDRSQLVDINGTIFFKTGEQFWNAYNIWKTNGTTCSTIVVGYDDNVDIKGIFLSDKYILSTWTEAYGRELYSLTTLDLPGCEQVITFDEIPEKKVTDEPFGISASTTSELPLTFSVEDESIATITDGVVTLHKAGETQVTASQDGTNVFLPAEAHQVLTVLPITGLEGPEEHFVFLYPNPAKDQIVVGTDFTGKPTVVVIFDALGRRVDKSVLQENSSGQSLQLDISKLRSGIYYVKFVIGSTVTTKAFVKA